MKLKIAAKQIRVTVNGRCRHYKGPLYPILHNLARLITTFIFH